MENELLPGCVVRLTSGGPAWNLDYVEDEIAYCLRYENKMIFEELPVYALELNPRINDTGFNFMMYKVNEIQQLDLSSLIQLSSGGPVWNVEEISAGSETIIAIRFDKEEQKVTQELPVNAIRIVRKKTSDDGLF